MTKCTYFSRPVWCHDRNRGWHSASNEVSETALDKIKAFFKRPKPEAKGAGKKVGEASGKKGDESSSK